MRVRYLVYCAAVIAATFLYGLIRYPGLPDTVPIHWGVSGKPDGWAGKQFLLWFVPLIQAGLVALVGLLAAIPSQRRRIEPFAQVFGQTMVAFTAFFAWLQWLMFEAALGRDFVSKGLMVAMFLLFAFIGNMLGKTRRNSLMGIRTPWTLASDEAWHATHRWGGKFMVVVALVGLVAALADASLWIQMVLLMAWGFGPLLYSLKFRPRA